MAALTVQEQIDLSQLEERIERGVKACLEMAWALKEIHDRKLYRLGHETFEQYCLSRWQLSDRHIRNLIDYAEVSAILKSGTTVPLLPEHERQTRPLKPLLPEQQVEAWEAAVAIAPAGKPTSTEVARAAAAVKAAKVESFIPGQQTTVLDESSRLYGQPVRIGQVEGVIIHCETLDGQAIAPPFLANELAAETPKTPVDSTWKPTPKIDRAAGLEISLEVERERVKVLESVLQRLVMAARAGSLSNQLLVEAELLLG